MEFRPFQLTPFFPPPSDSLVVTGSASIEGSVLHLVFRLSGELHRLLVPDPAPRPLRRDGLWQTTCCECFLRPTGGHAYHELNLSPSGCWNLYRFDGYRRGGREEPAVSLIRTERMMGDGLLQLRCEVPLEGLAEEGAALALGISCVIEHRDGSLSYWALCHPGTKPDFHHPESFRLQLQDSSVLRIK